MPADQATDPLHVFDGDDRVLRDEIESRITNYINRLQSGAFVPGTLHLANDIMWLAQARESVDDGECMHVKTWGM